MGTCDCGNDLVYAGVGRLPERCETCRKAKVPLPRKFGEKRVLDLQADLTAAETKVRSHRKRIKHQKGTIARQEKRLEDIKDVKKALTKANKDRDHVITRLEEQREMMTNQRVVIKNLRDKVDAQQKALEAPALEPVTLRTAVEVASVPCPSCKKAAMVMWRRTATFDLLEGKCAHCGHHMNDIKPHGQPGVE